MKYIVDIKGEIEGDYEIIGKYDERPQGEYTEEDMKRTIKENFDLGYEMAKNKYKRPQGEWIRIDAFVVKCSVCGVESFETPFCPLCGADMRGEEK